MAGRGRLIAKCIIVHRETALQQSEVHLRISGHTIGCNLRPPRQTAATNGPYLDDHATHPGDHIRKDRPMNKLALTAAVAATISLFGIVPAAAQAETVTISYSDLDLSTATGTDVLAKRVELGAEAACQCPDMRSVKAMAVFEGCKTAAVSNAVDQLSRAGVNIAAAN
ncbi:MAG: hypothetical protein B7Z08_11780 [Sphingomonadales bacterium 32-68-7]|nr:MAG: hypothetical protein B7Z08_11780 [Sphingomonadales bacterium 32-68-7]